ncbi:MAG: gliding motility protein GldM [Bacteroides sp.]|nr:gliding motility protein GldM [Bacteroides sp.]MCM1457173.1 gliding motility protein GldM [Lachnoclostridium sp.]
MGSNNTRLSPRQKMINLMYIVLTAMLALNVSSDVLDGFTQVHDGLNRSNSNVGQRNDVIYRQLEEFARTNPDKGLSWYDKASEVRKTTSGLYAYVDSVKLAIVRAADGKDGDPENIKSRDDLEAASVTMLSPATLRGEKLRHRIDDYRSYITQLLPDSLKRANISAALSTDPILLKGTLTPQTWEEAQFDQKPVVAAVTLLTKLQNDILYAEGEALATLYSQIDAGDVRVNELNAFVIPQSRIVMRGGKYQANIVLAAVDTTQRPEIFINGSKLANSNGIYELGANSTGTFDYKGYLEVQHGDGSTTRHDFSSAYTVIEPMATVSATMMNVLYAGIDNPVSISVPGVPMSAISASMTNGTLTRSGDHWVARPATVGKEAVLSVTANIDGRSTTVANSTFRVRKLPDPTAYIAFTDQKGNVDHYKGGRPFAKTLLMQAPGLEAAIDDGLLDTKFKVVGFETVFFDSMGNAIPEVSDGANFSQRQKQSFQRLSRGKRFYISRIRAIGPDGITRDLSPMEVIVN